MLSYITTLNLVRLGTKHKLKFIRIPKNKRAGKMLNILLRYNLIYGWSIFNAKKPFEFIVYCNPSAKSIHTLIKVNKKLTLKRKHIQILILKYSSSTIFLSTPKGIIHINDAFEKKIGGFLFFRII